MLARYFIDLPLPRVLAAWSGNCYTGPGGVGVRSYHCPAGAEKKSLIYHKTSQLSLISPSTFDVCPSKSVRDGKVNPVHTPTYLRETLSYSMNCNFSLQWRVTC